MDVGKKQNYYHLDLIEMIFLRRKTKMAEIIVAALLVGMLIGFLIGTYISKEGK